MTDILYQYQTDQHPDCVEDTAVVDAEERTKNGFTTEFVSAVRRWKVH